VLSYRPDQATNGAHEFQLPDYQRHRTPPKARRSLRKRPETSSKETR